MRVNIVLDLGEGDSPSREDVFQSQGASQDGVWDVLFAQYCTEHKTFVLMLHPKEIDEMGPLEAVCLQGKIINAMGALTAKLSHELQVTDITEQILHHPDLEKLLNQLFPEQNPGGSGFADRFRPRGH